MNDFYIPRVTFCLMFVAGFSSLLIALWPRIPEVSLVAYDSQ